MLQNIRLEYLFVINSGSGSRDHHYRDEKIRTFLEDHNISDGIYMLPEHFDIKQIKDHVLEINPVKVIAVGGDGTVTMMANVVSGTDIALGIIPGGSANGMAKELGIPENIDEALMIIAAGVQSPVDLIKINNNDLCLHLSDIGLNAHLIKHFDEGKLRGKLGYALVIIKTLWRKQKMSVVIHTNDKQVKREAFMVALANATMYGTGAVINPEGRIDDGLFEVIIVRRLSFAALLKMLLKPGLFNPKHIEIVPCTSVEISTSRKVHFQIDGEYKGKIKDITAFILPKSVKMILPKSRTV
jgi:YegS/Rv2252/BmrU family lipid kinase